MRDHARRLLAAFAVAACAAALAAPAGAVEVRIDVTNAAAPTVRIVTPVDGARIAAGTTVAVRVEGRGADTLSMAVGARPTWSAPGDVLAGEWSPRPGTYRLTAVAERAGAPDALAVSDVEVVAPGDGSNGAAPATPPPVGTPPTGPPAPGPAPGPGTPAPAPGSSGPGVPGGGSPATAAPAPAAGVLPGPAAATALGPAGSVPAAGAAAPVADGGGAPHTSPAMALARAIGRILSSPERVAWVVAFPLLLLIAAIAYALLQRFIDGGPKLAWRGRGRSEDQVIEF